MFIFFTASAWTRIITSDLSTFYNSAGFLLLFVQLFFLLLSKNLIPLGKFIQPVRFGVHHVLIEKFFVKSQIDFCILVYLLNRVLNFQTVINTIQESDHGHNFYFKFICQVFHCAADHFVRVGQKFFIDSFFNQKIVGPEFLQLRFVCFLRIRNVSPFL